MSNMNPKLEKIIFSKLFEDLKDKNIVCWKNEFWILDIETTDWYLCVVSQGSSWFNQDFFKTYTNLFSLSNKELSSILKIWVEDIFKVRVHQLSRRQSNMTYIIDGMLRSKKNKWSLNERYGFSYEVVKKFLNLKGKSKELVVEDFISL